MIKADCIDAAEGRKILRNLNLQPMEGANSDVVEYWVATTGHPYYIAYCRKGDRDRFLRHSFEKVVDLITL